MPEGPSKKERREAAKKERYQAQKQAARQRVKKRITTTLVSAGLVALIVGFFAMQSSRSGEKARTMNALASSLGCTELAEYESMGQTHIGPGETGTYDRLPPDSGNHFGGGWANTGVHSTSIPNEVQGHNMEHGHVGLQYAPNTPQTVIDALNDTALSDSAWVFSAPYESFRGDSTLAFTAWRNRIECSSVNGESAEDFGKLAKLFADSRKNNGPESVPGTPNTEDS